MDFDSLLRRFGVLFSLFGISPFTTSETVQKWKTNVYLLFIIGLLASAIYFRFYAASYDGTVNSIISYIHIFIELFLHFAIIGQTLVFRERLRKLCCSYDFIQKFMKTRMQHNVDFNVFQRRLYFLIVTVFVPSLTTLILRRALTRTDFLSAFNNIRAFFYLLSSLVQLHIIVHLELLKFFLTLMQQWLLKQATEISATFLYQQRDLLKTHQLNVYNKILQLKFIHFNLWSLSVNVNRIFGWSLGAIIVRNSIEVAYGAYWVYVSSIQGASFIVTIRKFDFLW